MNRNLSSVATLVLAVAMSGCQKGDPPPVVLDEHSALLMHTAAACVGSHYDGAGLGALRIGATVDSVRRLCTVVRDTTEVREEGMPARILAVAFGTDTVEAEIDSGRVWRIALTQARFQTEDSLGVGVPIAHLLTLSGIHGMTAEGALYLASPTHCGLSFRITDPALRAPPPEWTATMLRRLPATSIVTEVLIVGCQAAV